MNIFEKRWENAIRVATEINNYIDEGYIVLDEEGTPVSKFTITETEITVKHSDGVTYEYFENNKDFDHGMHTKIRDYNDRFSKWTIIDPKAIKRLNL